MARKQETPAPTAKVEASASTDVTGSGQPEASQGPVQSGTAEAGAGVAEGVGQQLPASQEGGVIPQETQPPDLAAPTAEVSQPEAEGLDASGALNDGSVEHQAPQALGAGNLNPLAVQIYPLRSYMDEGELRRRNGPAYSVPRRHAEDLVQRNLGSFEPLQE